jgi:AcrR family transcriptional regulator
VTHRSVAREAGLSPGSATYHFHTRDEMIRDAFHYHMQWFEQQLADRGLANDSIGNTPEALAKQIAAVSGYPSYPLPVLSNQPTRMPGARKFLPAGFPARFSLDLVAVRVTRARHPGDRSWRLSGRLLR